MASRIVPIKEKTANKETSERPSKTSIAQDAKLCVVDRDRLRQIQRRTDEVYHRLDAALKAFKSADFNSCECEIQITGPLLVLKDAKAYLNQVLNDFCELRKDDSLIPLEIVFDFSRTEVSTVFVPSEAECQELEKLTDIAAVEVRWGKDAAGAR